MSARSQTTLAAGDLAFVGYIMADDGVNGTTQDDEFSFILLKDITAGTVIKFTDFGWESTGGAFQTANPCGVNTGSINDGIITWTATTNLSCGTQVRIRCKYTLQASTGTVTGTQACNNDATAYLSLAIGGDQIFAYQGTHASPTLVAGISLNRAWDASLTNCFFSSNHSILPAALSSGANNAAISGGVNAKYNCSLTNELPVNLLPAINNPANWNLDNTMVPPVPVAFQLPLSCSFGCTAGPTISTTAVTGTIVACLGSPSASPDIQQFNASGVLLTADILVTAPANFEVSLNAGSGYGSTVTLVQSGGTVASTTVYIRSSAAAAPAGPINGNVTLTSTGATTQNVAVNGTINGAPTTANAGSDRTLCQPSSSLAMAANTPTVGTGTWTQTGGPITATIANANNPTTGVSGMTTAGTYTFVWTITNAPCPPSTDEMTITVAAPPAPFSIVGADACQGSTITLNGPAGANITYTWQRSLSGIAGSYTAFGGTAQTQQVTTSGNYQLVVTNLAGCTASDTAVVHIADYVFNGSISAGDPSQTGRINRLAQTSVCPGPKAFPGMFVTTGGRLYDSYTITNVRSVPICATIGIASGCGTNIFNVAYTNSFNPADPSQNYLGDPGSSFPASGFMEVTIPANGTIVVVVHEVNSGTGCASYKLTVEVPRDPAGITVSPTPPVCSGTATTLTAPVANTYSWNPGGATTQAISVNPTTTTNYDVTLGYGNNGCTNNISTSVTVNPVATADAGPDDATCGLTYPALAANTPAVGAGVWSQVSGPGTATFTNGSSPTSGVTVTANGIYTFRWTVTAGAPCPGTAQDDVDINFAGNPSTANAGIDRTACVSPATATLNATAPTVGTGAWTQVAGPVTANISSPTSPTTNITGLNTTGTYTFRWTVSNNPCPSNFDDVDVVVNSNPAAPVITGGGTFCPPGTTLAGTIDPNYTYQWGRSFLTTPFTNLGTGQTQAVTASGNYQLTVTDQFGCSASATTTVNVADYVFNGSLGAGDAQQTGRLNRFAQISTCAAPKACPGTFTTTGSRFYDAYTITNIRNVPVCATIGLNSGCGTAVFSAAYSGSFDPNAPCTNYLADPGSSPAASIFYEATIPANGTIVVVVHEVNPGQGCANYTLTVDVPRDLSPIDANPPSVVCNGTSTLTAPVAGSYLWSPGGQTTQSIVTPPLFVPTQFDVTLGYGNNGCTRTDNVTVGVTSLPPTITCPSNISLSNTIGQCGRVVTYTVTAGGLPTPTLTYSFTGATTGSGSGDGSGSFFNVGTTTVTVTATNACGTVNCSFTVTINDTEQPTVTVGTIASCYPTAAAAEAAALAATTATDNCPGTLTEVASTVGTCSAVITVTTTDVAGNPTAVTYNTRIDNTAPTVTTGTIASCYATVAAAEAAALAATTATDNCPGALTEVASTVGTCSAVITVTTTDGCGNTTSVTYNTRIDNTPPVITCPGPLTVCGAAAVPAPNTSLVTATDNCPGAITITHQGDAGTPNPVAPYTITRTYRATDGCGNFAECTQIITVNPIPTVNAVTSQVRCNGANTAAVNFTGAVTGTVFNWVNNAPSIGLAASGSGNIASFVATNTGNAPVVATITVTPTFTNAGVTCTGTPTSFTITVNPTPAVTTVPNQTVCNGANTAQVIFGGPVAGTLYSWTNSNSSIGLAASGNGILTPVSAVTTMGSGFGTSLTNTFNGVGLSAFPSYNAVHASVIPTNSWVSAGTTTGTVTFDLGGSHVINGFAFWNQNAGGPGATGSTGIRDVQVLSSTDGVTFTPIPGGPTTFSRVTTGAGSIPQTFGFAPVTATFIRLNILNNHGDAQTGFAEIAFSKVNIPSFTAVNPGLNPVTATVTVTPSYTNGGVTCVGTPSTFTITVNPTPTITCPANQSATTPAGSCTAVVNYAPVVTGTPTPTLSYTFSGATTGSGSGTGSGSAFNIGVTTVTLTATNICATVSCSFTVTVLDGQLPVITAQPQNRTVCAGQSATFSVTAITSPNANGPLSYQWQSWNGSAWVNVTGATANSFTVSNTTLSQNTNSYRVLVTGLCTTVPSNHASLYVNPNPTVTLTTNIPPAILPTQSVTITAVPSIPGGTYQWYKNGVLIAGATSQTLGPLTVADIGSYRVVYTAPTGCTGTSADLAVTGLATPNLYVYPNPNRGQFTVQFYNQSNEEVTLRIFDAKGALVYQRKYATTLPYTNINVNLADGRILTAGVYVVDVLDSGGRQIGTRRIIVYQ